MISTFLKREKYLLSLGILELLNPFYISLRFLCLNSKTYSLKLHKVYANFFFQRQELVPCVLLSFDDEQILMWRGKDWKPMYGNAPPVESSRIGGVTNEINSSERSGMHEILTHPGGQSTAT